MGGFHAPAPHRLRGVGARGGDERLLQVLCCRGAPVRRHCAATDTGVVLWSRKITLNAFPTLPGLPNTTTLMCFNRPRRSFFPAWQKKIMKWNNLILLSRETGVSWHNYSNWGLPENPQVVRWMTVSGVVLISKLQYSCFYRCMFLLDQLSPLKPIDTMMLLTYV